MLSDRLLRKAVSEIEKGLVEANLGGNLYKKRISLKGRGKRGGARTLVIFKNDEKLLKIYGKALIKLSDVKINEAIKSGELIEIKEVI